MGQGKRDSSGIRGDAAGWRRHIRQRELMYQPEWEPVLVDELTPENCAHTWITLDFLGSDEVPEVASCNHCGAEVATVRVVGDSIKVVYI